MSKKATWDLPIYHNICIADACLSADNMADTSGRDYDRVAGRGHQRLTWIQPQHQRHIQDLKTKNHRKIRVQ